MGTNPELSVAFTSGHVTRATSLPGDVFWLNEDGQVENTGFSLSEGENQCNQRRIADLGQVYFLDDVQLI